MIARPSRRRFLGSAAFAGAALWLPRGLRAGDPPPSDRLDVAFIGVGGRGGANVAAVAGLKQNVVALCDVDEDRGRETFVKYPWARTYRDYRVMLDELGRQIDAVVVSTPDHTHAPPAAAAIKLGKHIYCEKPLTHNVAEARTLAELAAKHGVVTQMGTQHHAKDTPRQVVQLIRGGVIGAVRECHVWIGGNRGGGERPAETPPVPPHLDWDLWVGPAPYRPYHSAYAPYSWRFWWDFGTGETGNNGCHIMDYASWPLELGHPATVEAEGPPVHAETSPRSMHVRYTFPARGAWPPLALDWYHAAEGPPALKRHGLPQWESGVLFVGEKGMLLATYDQWKLFPEATFAGATPPGPAIPPSVGHHREWVEACKTGGPTSCSFDYGSTLTEIVLLGNVAYRTSSPLVWDAQALKATNCPAADRYLRETYRPHWAL